ncbi:MAG: SDR family NAD(P)-dependent oxidoreductase [Rhodanobacteraceae bacterium]|nr:SDR family NAD(P)-dependent oxidoreductase [Rhodanobacteraceae bacterium]
MRVDHIRQLGAFASARALVLPWQDRALAAEGAQVIAHGRNAERGQTLVDEINAAGVGTATFVGADFASLDSVRAFADTIARDHPKLDLLVNNAGIGLADDHPRETSADSYEPHWAVNYLAGWVLIHRLRPALEAAAPSRIINVASLSADPIAFDDVNLEQPGAVIRAYGQSKLAQVSMTAELAAGFAADGITMISVHPATMMAVLLLVVGRGSSGCVVEAVAKDLGVAEAEATVARQFQTASRIADQYAVIGECADVGVTVVQRDAEWLHRQRYPGCRVAVQFQLRALEAQQPHATAGIRRDVDAVARVERCGCHLLAARHAEKEPTGLLQAVLYPYPVAIGFRRGQQACIVGKSDRTHQSVGLNAAVSADLQQVQLSRVQRSNVISAALIAEERIVNCGAGTGERHFRHLRERIGIELAECAVAATGSFQQHETVGRVLRHKPLHQNLPWQHA